MFHPPTHIELPLSENRRAPNGRRRITGGAIGSKWIGATSESESGAECLAAGRMDLVPPRIEDNC